MQVQVKKESQLQLESFATSGYISPIHVDPAVLVDYVEDGEAEDADGRSLWDYKHNHHQGYGLTLSCHEFLLGSMQH